jgi:putative ABC transport system permease protein
MLVARSSVNAKIDQVKATAGTNITISPAGVMGFSGGGNDLTSTQLATITKTAHISSTAASLSDRLQTSDTNLTPSLELGNFGARMQRSTSLSSDTNATSTNNTDSSSESSRPVPTPSTYVTGTTDPNTVSTDGSALKLKSGSTINGKSDNLVALVGSDLATKNSLTVGRTFTAYGKTITVSGIFNTGNKFQDSGIIMPLATLQNLTSQADMVSSVTATVDSSSNVSGVVTTLKSSLGDKVDIVSQAEQAATSVQSLEGIASLALAGVIGATIAGAVIVLLAMVMIVRERRREIGVIKAIGGTNRTVIGQFVTEALTLTLIGSIVGFALGVAVSGPMTNSLVSSSSSASSSQTGRPEGGPSGIMRRGFNQLGTNLTQVTSSLTPQIFISAVGITLVIAIVGSAVPAWFIARVRPSEVLRSE